MPFYVYLTDDGERVELFMSIEEMSKRQNIDGTMTLDNGKTGHRDFKSELYGRRTVEVDHVSESLGAPDAEALVEIMANDKKYFGTEAPDYYDPQGRAHWQGDIGTVIRRKRKYMEAQGFHDRADR